MKKTLLAATLLLIVGSIACNRGGVTNQDFKIENSVVSVSYAIGMNIGLNLIEKAQNS